MSRLAAVSPSRTTAPPAPLLWRVGLASAAATLAGAVFLSGSNPFSPPRSALVRVVLEPDAVASLFVALGLLGCLAVGWLLARPTPGARAVLTGVTVVEVLGLGVALQSVTTISLAGYLLAMALPVGLVCLAVQALRRYPRLRWPVLAVVAAVLAWGLQTGSLRPRHLAGLAQVLGVGFARNAPMLLLAVLIAVVGACWVVLAMALARGAGVTGRAGDWAAEHRRGLTLLAAAGPLPYGLLRATWFTPWPLLAPGEVALDPEIRLWGLLLGGGALLGSVLTLGLIRPWGVTFPRWMPKLGGRPVPVRAATVPGGLVAGILCASAMPMLVAFLLPEAGSVFEGGMLQRLAMALIFPFWLWGPALALAVWGYARWRSAPRA